MPQSPVPAPRPSVPPGRIRRLVALLLAALLVWGGSAAAQEAPEVSGPLAAVEVRGATANADIVRVIIAARPGTPVERIDLEAERNRIYGLGTYREVSVSLEPRRGGPVLVIELEENPRVAEVRFEGNSTLSDTLLSQTVARENLIQAGEIYNTIRAEDAIATIREAYRTPGAPFFAGYPFDVGVSLRVAPEGADPSPGGADDDSDAPGEEVPDGSVIDDDAADGDADSPAEAANEAADDGPAATGAVTPAIDAPVVLTYRIDEEAPIDTVAFEGNTVLDDDELTAIFRPLAEAETFDFSGYQTLVQRVDERYRELGYRGSGIDREATRLENGTLTVAVRELRIGAIDTTALGVGSAALSLDEGDLFNYDTLLEDVRRLAEGRSGDVRLTSTVLPTGRVRVTFRLGPPESAGPIEEIVIEGNTVFGDEELRELLTLEEGDTFTSTLAQEDFNAIVDRYQRAGYRLLPPEFYREGDPQPFNFVDGTYVLRPVELVIGSYRLDFGADRANVEPFVVTRYLPEPGTVFNATEVNRGLRELNRLEVVQPRGVNLSFSEDQPSEGFPDRVEVVLQLRPLQTGLFQPSAQYATDSGFSAAVSYSQGNLWGRAHDVSVELNGQTSDVGLLFGGSVRYTIPWLYLDLENFDTTNAPTEVSGSLFSVVNSNRPLTAGGNTRVQYPGLPEGESNRVNVGEVTERNTGFSVSFGRPIAPDTSLRLAARTTFNQVTLEPPAVRCEFGDDGGVTNGDRCSLPVDLAQRYLPVSGVSTFLSGGVVYDGRDGPDFPTGGLYGTASAGVGFGTDFRNPRTDQQQAYTYQQIELGGRAYLQLRDISDEIDDPNHVFAVRVNGGHQFGGEYPTGRRFRVGRSNETATKIRGYELDDFNLSRSYLTSSVEYRYDFGLDTFATQTIIGIAFVDVGYASDVPGYDPYTAPLFGGAGIGVQVNLGFSGVLLPALRFDYGFSQRHPGGVFSFGIGSVF